MSPVKTQIIELVDMLPEQEQELAFEFIKRMVLAWDSDFTKLTSLERERILNSNNEYINNEVIDHKQIDW